MQLKHTWEAQVRAGCRRLFNNSKYFVRNGTSSITDCTWIVGNSPVTHLELYNNNLTDYYNTFNFQNDQGSSGGMYPGIQSLQSFPRNILW